MGIRTHSCNDTPRKDPDTPEGGVVARKETPIPEARDGAV